MLIRRIYIPSTIIIRTLTGFKGRSFLSDSEGARTFVDLLGPEERQVLFDELKSRHAMPVLQEIELPPTVLQLRQMAFHQSLPFIGFGFLDNFIMIVAGEYIDTTIGVTLGISTMAAAGLGNAISDVAGLGSAWYVEWIAAKIGVACPKLSETQSKMTRTRWSIQLGRIAGIFLGCLIGMFPLLFVKPKKQES